MTSKLILKAVQDGIEYARIHNKPEAELARTIANMVEISITQEFLVEIPRAKDPESLDRLRKKILGDPKA